MTAQLTRWENPNPPRTLLAIDPGASDPKKSKKGDAFPYVGAALFVDGTLSRAKTIVCPTHMVRREVKYEKAPPGARDSEGKRPPPEPIEVSESRWLLIAARPNALVRVVCEEMGIPRHGGGAYARVNERGAAKGGMGGDGDGAWCNKCGRGGYVDMGEALTVLAVEGQYFNPKKPLSKEVIALSRITGAFLAGVDADFYSCPTPEDWKGSIDGEQLNERVITVLNAAERSVLQQGQFAGHASLTSHALDGVGLGLYTLGRAGKAMVI